MTIDKEQIIANLREVYDPEISINVYAVSYTHLTLPTNREV